MTYLPQVDMIYVLKDGSIPERGTYKELLEKKQEFADFLMQHLTDRFDSDSEMGNYSVYTIIFLNTTHKLSRMHIYDTQESR